jgi:RNA polymerase sigma factor (sigma-70 family)
MMGPEILGELVDKHARTLVLYARQWCAAPEDVVQEAFMKMVIYRPAPNKVVPYLYQMVRNGALSAARSDKRRRRHETAAAGLFPAWFESGEDALLDGQAVARALQMLPPEPREAITLHLWGGLTFEEIAEVAGCSSSTAHRWYVAGLDLLRERLRVHVPTES